MFLDKRIIFESIDGIFGKKLLAHDQQEWNFWLRDIVVPSLPEQDFVFSKLKAFLNKIF